MIAQLDTPLWEDIFKRIEGVDREQVLGRLMIIWDQASLVQDKVCSMGVFFLKNRCFLFVKAVYNQKACLGDSGEVAYHLADVPNYQEALMTFLPFMSKEEKDFLRISIHLKDHPAYQG